VPANLRVPALLLPLGILTFSLSVEAQRLTIPELVARGGVGSVATAPSGQLPTVADLLRVTDVIVMGTVGEPRSYLSADQRDVFTDYPLTHPVFIHGSSKIATPMPGVVPRVIVTQLGGTVAINGIQFTQKEPALPPLQTGMIGLFLLQRVGDKYLIAGRFYGAFDITDDEVTPLMSREDFAPDYRKVRVSDAIERMVKVRSAQVPVSPK
jgi:hypothetical protein